LPEILPNHKKLCRLFQSFLLFTAHEYVGRVERHAAEMLNTSRYIHDAILHRRRRVFNLSDSPVHFVPLYLPKTTGINIIAIQRSFK